MDDITLAFLKLYKSKNKPLSLSDLSVITDNPHSSFISNIVWLLDNGYLEVDPGYSVLHGDNFSPKAKLIITQDGIIEIDRLSKAQRKHKFNEIRAWITLTISIAAFIKSFFL